MGKYIIGILLVFFSISCESQKREGHGAIAASRTDSGYVAILFNVPVDTTDSPYSYWGASTVDALGNIDEYRLTKGQKAVQVPISSLASYAVGNSSYGFDFFLANPGDTVVVSLSGTAVRALPKTGNGFLSVSQFYDIAAIQQANQQQAYQNLLTKAYDKKMAFGNLYTLTLKKTNPSKELNDLITFNKNQFGGYRTLLDSLYKQQSVSDSYFEWMKFRLAKDYLSQQTRFFRDAKFDMLPEINDLGMLSDARLAYPYNDYKAFLNQFCITEVILSGKTVKKGGGQLSYNFKEAFDSAGRFAKGKTLEYIRYFCLRNIKNEETAAIFALYFEKFKKTCTSKDLLATAEETLRTSWAVDKNSKNPITNLSKENGMSIETVLASLKGKVVFIDLWASWCMPCRAAMPASKKLIERYSGKNLVYVYLSIDTDFSKWAKAARDERVDSYQYSYIIGNSKDSKFLKELKVDAIPRHLLFDKNGKLVVANAPAADAEEIDSLLAKYL
jgi:thiol-disulfide isomerase/thioredoxin